MSQLESTPFRGVYLSNLQVFYKDESNRTKADQFVWNLYCVKILRDDAIVIQESELWLSFTPLINFEITTRFTTNMEG